MSTVRRIARRIRLLAVVAVFAATLISEGLLASGLARGAENFYSDLWHRWAGVRFTPSQTALVLVDERSLMAHPDEPLVFWSPHFARAIATLRAAGVRLVALDLIFSSSPERWLDRLGLGELELARQFDQPLRQQIHAGAVQLAGFAVGRGERAEDFFLPSPEYLLALPGLDLVGHVGLANVQADADGTVRRFSMAAAGGATVRAEGLPRFSFAGLAAAKVRGLDLQGSRFAFGRLSWREDEDIPVTFAGPPGTYPALSFETLLLPGAAELPEVRALAGKVVIVGGGFAGNNDLHSTPYSTGLLGAKAMMAGPELQANLVETLLNGRYLRQLPPPLRLAVFLAASGLLAALALRLPAWQGLLLLGAFLFASSAAAYALFRQDILFPLAHLQLGLVVVLGSLLLLRLTHEERERRRVGRLFGRYVSPQVVAALLEAPDLPELGGQSREVTILFMDIRNFTTISERLSAREVVEMLNQFFERVCAELLREGATIDKFIGDAVMAEFGAPLAQADHAARALRAAVALRRTAAEFRDWMGQRFAGRDLPDFAVGVGLHSGEAVVGNIGSSTRMEYTAIGDTVNLASRLEGKTKETGCAILASASTVAAAGGSALTGRSFLLSVKGREQPVEAFEILDAS